MVENRITDLCERWNDATVSSDSRRAERNDWLPQTVVSVRCSPNKVHLTTNSGEEMHSKGVRNNYNQISIVQVKTNLAQ